MESSSSLDLGMNTTRSKKMDATTNRTGRDVQKAIDDQFEEESRTSMGINYSESQMRPKPSTLKVI